MVNGRSSSSLSGPSYLSATGYWPFSVIRYFAFRSSRSLRPSPSYAFNTLVWFQNRRAKWRKKENTKKGPGRPAHNAHPQTCSGEPIPPEEIERRERDRREKKLRKQLERQAKRLQQARLKPGVNLASLRETIQQSLTELWNTNPTKEPRALVGPETFRLLETLGFDVIEVLSRARFEPPRRQDVAPPSRSSADDSSSDVPAHRFMTLLATTTPPGGGVVVSGGNGGGKSSAFSIESLLASRGGSREQAKHVTPLRLPMATTTASGFPLVVQQPMGFLVRPELQERGCEDDAQPRMTSVILTSQVATTRIPPRKWTADGPPEESQRTTTMTSVSVVVTFALTKTVTCRCARNGTGTQCLTKNRGPST
ncbi:hypothetical protein MTO96_025552 [Rhipicephalus appendiculatus]